MPAQIPVSMDVDHRRCVVGGEPLIFHCHHYNVFLQRTLRDAEFFDSAPWLIGAGAEVGHAMLSQVFAQQQLRTEQRVELAQDFIRWAGFGTVDLSRTTANGGAVLSPTSHYAHGWRLKFGQAKEQVCYFLSGWLSGALSAIHDLPNGSFTVEHPQCSAVTGSGCRFELARNKASWPTPKSVGLGPLTSRHEPRPIPPTPVDYDGIFKAVSGMPLVGNAEGQIPAFGVYLTRHYANYYNRISFELLRYAEANYGKQGIEAASAMLIEAGHVCAFHTFGGIMTSTEWDALIRPTLKSREDWVHGMIAIANTLGWGRWQVTQVSEKAAEFVLHDDYESVGYLAMYGKSTTPVSYLAHGGVAGLMNLVYLGDIASKPELSEAYYQRLFKSTPGYQAQPLTSRAMGDGVTSFRVTRP
jgi:hypothetical protein